MQYLDDLEDFVYALALAAGRIRRAAKAVLLLIVSIALQISILLLAVAQPPLGLAVVTVLSVVLLYRAATNGPGKAAPVRL
jgi:hypothetical protein